MRNFCLTIDDGPSQDFEEKCNFLDKHRIPAIFFCLGKNLEERPEVVIKAIKNGFLIGNHSYSHPHFSEISQNEAKEEITKTDEIIEKLYLLSGRKRTAKIFRFPYGDCGDGKKGKLFNPLPLPDTKRRETIQFLLRELNYVRPYFPGIRYGYFQRIIKNQVDWPWTFDTMDWILSNNNTVTDFHKITKRLLQNHPKEFRGFWNFNKRWTNTASDEIILMHDHNESALFFPKIIELLMGIPDRFIIHTNS